MIRSLIVIAASSLVVTAAGTASAQELAKGFGTKGEFIVSADRLAPLFTYTNTKTTDNRTNPATTNSTSTTAIGLFPNFNDFAFNGNFYNVPRVGFDYTIIDRLTLGGSIAFATQLGSSNTQEQGGGSVSQDAAKSTYFALAPRIGYILPLSDLFAFWPRAGLSFNLLHTSTPEFGNGRGANVTNSTNTSLWALSLEPLFVLTPVQHFGFFAGPVLDIPLTGSTKTETTTTPPGGPAQTQSLSRDYSSLHFGITAGLLGWF